MPRYRMVPRWWKKEDNAQNLNLNIIFFPTFQIDPLNSHTFSYMPFEIYLFDLSAQIFKIKCNMMWNVAFLQVLEINGISDYPIFFSFSPACVGIY